MRIENADILNDIRQSGLRKILPGKPRLTVGLDTCGIGNGARAEFARLITEQLASGSQDMAESFQAFMKNLPGQTPNMMESFQQAMSTANQAFEQIAKASTAAMNSMGDAVRKSAGKHK